MCLKALHTQQVQETIALREQIEAELDSLLFFDIFDAEHSVVHDSLCDLPIKDGEGELDIEIGHLVAPLLQEIDGVELV